MAYSKLHSSIVNSSLWTEPDSVRILFVTLLAICDRDGIAYGSRAGLSRLANIHPEEIDDAWSILTSPDPDSSDSMRAPEHEGRRIEAVPGGFRLLNFNHYRGLRNDDDRREQNRAAQAKFKARSKAQVSQGKPGSASLSQPKPISEAEAEAEAEDQSNGGAPVVPQPQTGHGQVPDKASVHTHTRAHSSISTERPNLAEVLLRATTIGLAAWKAEDWFNEMEAGGWLDYNHRPIQNWVSAMARVRSKWEADGRPSGPPSSQHRQTGGAAKTVFEMRAIIQAKEIQCTDLKHKFCSQTAMDDHWSDAAKRKEFFALRREIKDLNARISSS